MKKYFLLIVVSVLTFSCASPDTTKQPEFRLSKEVLDASILSPLKHSGPGQWDSYLSMDIPFPPVADLFGQVLSKENRAMSSRGEAHITVVTPVEYWNVLKPAGVTMEEIQQISERHQLQTSQFQVLCLGKGEKEIEGRIEKTYFVVVESENLLKVRRSIQSLLLKKTGSGSNFSPSNFYPHITLGFTKRDLHESDGIIKDKTSCFAEIEMVL
jgi:2'-5' RNA ligase